MKRRELFGRLAATAALVATMAWLPAAHAADINLAPIPDDSIALRYYRADGDYVNWGVHFWESFEKVQGDKIVGH